MKKIILGVITTLLLFGGAVTYASFDIYGQVPQPEEIINVPKNKTVFENDIKLISSNSVEVFKRIKESKKDTQIDVMKNDGTLSTLNLDDKELRKWIIRNSIDAKQKGKDISQDELILKSVKDLKERQDYFSYVEDFYNVKYSPSEVTKYISEQKDFFTKDEYTGPLAKNLSEGLGITIDELFFEWEYDNFLKNYVWLQVKSQLEKKYPIKEGELNYDNRLIEIFEKEFNDYSTKTKVKTIKIN